MGSEAARQPHILWVGAFPPANRHVYGGIVTSCRVLLQSSLATEATLILFDSAQITNPPPGFLLRLILAVRRFLIYLVRFERENPDVILVFTSAGASLVEKGAMVWYARARGVPSLMFPRGGALIDASRRSSFTRNWVRIAPWSAGDFVSRPCLATFCG